MSLYIDPINPGQSEPSLLAAATWDGKVDLLDMTTGQKRSSIKFDKPAWKAVFSSKGDLLIMVSGENTASINVFDISYGPPYYGLRLPFDYKKVVTGAFSNEDSIFVNEMEDYDDILDYNRSNMFKMYSSSVTQEVNMKQWRLPKILDDLHEMQLRTWVALGIQQDQQGELKAISPDQWNKMHEELRANYGVFESNYSYGENDIILKN